jgi:hypothetical protein
MRKKKTSGKNRKVGKGERNKKKGKMLQMHINAQHLPLATSKEPLSNTYNSSQFTCQTCVLGCPGISVGISYG